MKLTHYENFSPHTRLATLEEGALLVGRQEGRFDPGVAAPFVEKSLSEHTRRAYRLALADFFCHSGMKHPASVTPADVISWRDELVRKKKKAATVAFKLSVVRSFFEHLPDLRRAWVGGRTSGRVRL